MLIWLDGHRLQKFKLFIPNVTLQWSVRSWNLIWLLFLRSYKAKFSQLFEVRPVSYNRNLLTHVPCFSYCGLGTAVCERAVINPATTTLTSDWSLKSCIMVGSEKYFNFALDRTFWLNFSKPSKNYLQTSKNWVFFLHDAIALVALGVYLTDVFL